MSLRLPHFCFALLALACLQLHGWVHATHQLDADHLPGGQSCIACQLSHAGGTLQSHAAALPLSHRGHHAPLPAKAPAAKAGLRYSEPIRGPPAVFIPS